MLERKHFLQNRQYRRQRAGTQTPKPPYQSLSVNRAELVDRDESSATLKATVDTPRIHVPSRRHRHNDHGPQMVI